MLPVDRNGNELNCGDNVVVIATGIITSMVSASSGAEVMGSLVTVRDTNGHDHHFKTFGATIPQLQRTNAI